MYLLPTFGTPDSVSSVPEETDSTIIRHYPAKLLESLKSNFRFLFSTQKNTGSALCTLHDFYGENASQAAEIPNDVYGADTVTANYVQFWFRLFLSGIFSVKDAPRTGRSIVENVAKITEIIKVDRHVSSPSIAQELKIDHKTVLSNLRKVRFKKKLHVWVPHQLPPENMMYRISICEAFTKRNEIDTFLKRMMTGDEKWVTYYNIARKRSWSKQLKPGLTARKVLLCIWRDWKGIIH
ncbi:histone-lysine N-methyltransferase SETMAR [Trichonephila clavipes]|nr:histone-lysine N-methyltransferase SETMAR [Trichonephila clavipes]